VRSITSQPWHHEAPIASRTGFRSLAARSKGAAPQADHATPLDGRDRSVPRSTKLSDMVGVGAKQGMLGPAGPAGLSL
jgi:hypothetical protein